MKKNKEQALTKVILNDSGQVLKELPDGMFELVKGKTDWQELAKLTADEIQNAAARDPDAISTDIEFWQSANIVFPKRKQSIFIRLDNEVLQWFKAQGKGYQSRINAVLKAYMSAQQKLQQSS